MEKFGDICRSRESNTVYHMKKCHGIYTTLQNGFGSFYLLNFAIIQGKGSFHSPVLLNGMNEIRLPMHLPLLKRGESKWSPLSPSHFNPLHLSYNISLADGWFDNIGDGSDLPWNDGFHSGIYNVCCVTYSHYRRRAPESQEPQEFG